ncbi:transposase [Bradyrhizobium sp. 153]|uniref:transposase n=1 Tax=Bradyrhizobium sp. 153 TaxID=2782627 RepID=UPI001FF76C16|nr:transposase [Bradyrhizobium sp. 153]
MVENCTYYSHTTSALNRLEVVDTGRRRRWSEQEKARIVLKSQSEPRLVAATARRYGLSRSLLVTWRRAVGATGTKSEAGFVTAVVAEAVPAASVAASSESATVHSPERRIEIQLTGRRALLMRALTSRRFVGSSRFWIRDDSSSYGSSSMAGDGPHRHA